MDYRDFAVALSNLLLQKPTQRCPNYYGRRHEHTCRNYFNRKEISVFFCVQDDIDHYSNGDSNQN